MYTNLKIQNFRGFRTIEINNIKRINLIAGKNDVGKTSLLEAFFLNAGKNIQLILSINAFRGIDKIPLDQFSERPWNPLFYDKDTSRKIRISGDWNSKERTAEFSVEYSERNEPEFIISDETKYTKVKPIIDASETNRVQILKLEHTWNSTEVSDLRVGSRGVIVNQKQLSLDFPAYFYMSKTIANFEDADLFGRLDILSEIDNVTEILQIMEPRLKRLSVVLLNGEPVIHGDIGLSQLLPLPFMGEGLCRLLGIVLRIADSKGGIVLIDEIENGIHYSVSEKIWQAIDEVSKKYNVQIFATTHSYECISYAFRAFSSRDIDDFAFFRLNRKDENIIAKSFDAEILKYALETESEVR